MDKAAADISTVSHFEQNFPTMSNAASISIDSTIQVLQAIEELHIGTYLSIAILSLLFYDTGTVFFNPTKSCHPLNLTSFDSNVSE